MAANDSWAPGIILDPAALTEEIALLILATLTPAHIVALTAWAEGRQRYNTGTSRWDGNPIDAVRDILNVIDNRAVTGRWGDHRDVCLSPGQFACWMPVDGRPVNDLLYAHAQLILAGERLDHKLFSALHDADLLLRGRLIWEPAFPVDTWHYYADWLPAPAWAAGRLPVAERFGHRFYAGVE